MTVSSLVQIVTILLVLPVRHHEDGPCLFVSLHGFKDELGVLRQLVERGIGDDRLPLDILQLLQTVGGGRVEERRQRIGPDDVTAQVNDGLPPDFPVELCKDVRQHTVIVFARGVQSIFESLSRR